MKIASKPEALTAIDSAIDALSRLTPASASDRDIVQGIARLLARLRAQLPLAPPGVAYRSELVFTLADGGELALPFALVQDLIEIGEFCRKHYGIS